LSAEKITRAPISNLEIRGALWPEDAAKLYELAYFSKGDMLELGTKLGLSKIIMAEASRAGGNASTVYTVDIVRKYTATAKQNAASANLTHVLAETSDATTWLDNTISAGKCFTSAFIGHAHDYENVKAASERLDALTTLSVRAERRSQRARCSGQAKECPNGPGLARCSYCSLHTVLF